MTDALHNEIEKIHRDAPNCLGEETGADDEPTTVTFLSAEQADRFRRQLERQRRAADDDE